MLNIARIENYLQHFPIVKRFCYFYIIYKRQDFGAKKNINHNQFYLFFYSLIILTEPKFFHCWVYIYTNIEEVKHSKFFFLFFGILKFFIAFVFENYFAKLHKPNNFPLFLPCWDFMCWFELYNESHIVLFFFWWLWYIRHHIDIVSQSALK